MKVKIHFGNCVKLRQDLVVCFIIFMVIYWGWARYIYRVYEVTGDEPHYLLIAHSLAYDGDLDLYNNFLNADYASFYSHTLAPDTDDQAMDFGGSGVLLSKHDFGYPLLITPFYRLAGRKGVLGFQAGVTAFLMVLMYRWLAAHVQRRGAVLLACVTIGLTLPVMAFSSQVYPEIIAALFTLWAVMLLDARLHRQWTFGKIAGYSCVVGFLPWLSLKYAAISVVLVFWGMFRVIQARQIRKLLVIGAFIIPVSLFALVWLYIRLEFYGFLSPIRQYTDFSLSLANVSLHTLAILFDQEHGLLPYAPAYGLAPLGILVMWRNQHRAMLGPIASIFLVFFGLIASWWNWWGGVVFSSSLFSPRFAVIGLASGIFL